MLEPLIADAWLYSQLSTDAVLAAYAPLDVITLANATGGTFTITYNTRTTTLLPSTADALTVQAAVCALASVGTGNAWVRAPSPGGPYTIVLLNSAVNPTLPITATNTGLTGAGASVTVARLARVYNSLIPFDMPLPAIVFTSQIISDLMVVGAFRVWTDLTYVVKATIESQSYGSPLLEMANRIDTLLHRQANAVATGGLVIASYRLKPFRMAEFAQQQSKHFRHLGGEYKILAQSA